LTSLRSLATLRTTGAGDRWPRFLAALRIVQKGDVDGALSRLVGWRLARCSSCPAAFEWLAVDFDGDGRRDILHSPGDALASAANYLRRARWQSGGSWGMEVRLPPGFSGRGEGRKIQRPLSVWHTRGVQRVDGAPLVRAGQSPATKAGLHLPAGPNGPAFLVRENFGAVYRYNASEAYTLAIVHLADRLRGGAPFVTPCPDDLPRADRRAATLARPARARHRGPERVPPCARARR
jgi:membrane-bound lytic murein transglycosylase B